jgi:hypothetical protein
MREWAWKPNGRSCLISSQCTDVLVGMIREDEHNFYRAIDRLLASIELSHPPRKTVCDVLTMNFFNLYSFNQYAD